MATFAVISEYNPFHNGHKYQLETARTITGCHTAVALMSGSFVQRGEFAVYPKHIRAKAALSCGVDLVLENPVVCTLRSAEGYAAAAVQTLSALGCAEYLVFGAEHTNIDDLMDIAFLLSHETAEFKATLKNNLSQGLSFAAARAKTVSKFLGVGLANLLKQPNNLLAVEYLKAIIRQKSSLKPVLIKRSGAEHDSAEPTGSFASASYIRDLVVRTDGSALNYIPPEAYEIYRNIPAFNHSAAESSILAALCMMDTAKIADAPDISEGLENKIKREAMRALNLSVLTNNVKSKRYAYSRIKRAILCAYLGINTADTTEGPQYIKILDFNENGRRLLNRAKKTASLPLAKSAAPLRAMPKAKLLWERELKYDRVYEILHSRCF